MGAAPAGSGTQARSKAPALFRKKIFDDRKRKENHHESKTEREAHLREVQDHPAQGPGHGHLRKPQAQAEAGLIPEQNRRSGCVSAGDPPLAFPADADIDEPFYDYLRR